MCKCCFDCVGEPDAPQTAVSHNRPSLTASTAILGACDHDFTKFNLTPSVYLVCDIPDDSQSSFYRGQPVVIIKDSIFQPSSPYRHMAEFVDIAKDHFDEEDVPPLILFYHDGGPDHRVTYYSVLISYICAFIWLDLDFLVAVQTAPNNSWRNPCERLMSILNLGLHCVSTARARGSCETETKLKSYNSMAAIRGAAESDPSLKQAVVDSLAPVISLVENRFRRLFLKEKSFKIGDAATNEKIECLWSFAEMIDEQLSMSNTTKAEISSKAKDFMKFVKTHCRLRHYSIQIRKCNDHSCCHPVRMPQDVFTQMHWLPDPLLTADKSHYKLFEDVFGHETSECDRPSLAVAREKEHEPSSQFTGAKVRGVVECLACDKCRCIFAEKQSTYTDNKDVLILAVECNFYVCGSPILPEDHPLAKELYVRTSLTCQSPIERSYYSNKALKLAPICAHCGEKDCYVPQVLKETYKIVLPICMSCTNKKLDPITYMKIKTGDKRKHT